MILSGVWFVSQRDSADTLEALYGGREFSEEEINQIELAFRANGLTGWHREETRIFIPRQSKHEFLPALEQSATIPFAGKSRVEEAFEGGGYLEPESQRIKRYEVAKARDLGNKIAAFGDIAWASVEYDHLTTGGFEQKVIHSASVVLIPKNNQPLPPGRIRMIQGFVAAAYAGMDSDQVTVTDTSAGKTYCGSDDLESRERLQSEYDLEQRLTELLDGYKGLRIAVSSVSAPANAGSPADVGSADRPTSHSSRRAPLSHAPFQMRVSIGVPESQYHRQWISDYRSRQPDALLAPAPDSEQLQSARSTVIDNIRDAVSPFVADHSGSDAIRVWSFPDAKAMPQYAAASTWAPQVESLLEDARRHASLIAPIGILALITLGFVIAAARMRLRNSEPRLSRGHEGHASSVNVAAVSASPMPDRPMGETTRGNDNVSLKEDLAELVESNPELAAQIVHSWISKAA